MTTNNTESSPQNVPTNDEPATQIEGNSPNKSATTQDEPSFGWSAYAERINGRFAMIGFFAVLLVEVLSHNSFLIWAGILK